MAVGREKFTLKIDEICFIKIKQPIDFVFSKLAKKHKFFYGTKIFMKINFFKISLFSKFPKKQLFFL